MIPTSLDSPRPNPAGRFSDRRPATAGAGPRRYGNRRANSFCAALASACHRPASSSFARAPEPSSPKASDKAQPRRYAACSKAALINFLHLQISRLWRLRRKLTASH